MDELSQDHKWLLSRIKNLEGLQRWPTHKNIWQGSYDVWCCSQDQIDAVEIPKRRMKEAEEAGLITSEARTKSLGKKEYNYTVWMLTDLGEKLLEELGGAWWK